MNRLASAEVAIEEGRTAVPEARQAMIRTEGLRKEFYSGGQQIVPLDGIDFSAERGELIAIIGPSGSGKSTFLHLLAALDTPTNGTVYFAEKSLRSFAESELAEYRNRSVGFVWQRHHLLPDFTAAENVAIPLLVQGRPANEALRAAERRLGEVGLASRAGQRAGELSGGEQQRVAIARALVNDPVLLLADEPTGDLDERNAAGVFDLIEGLHRSHHLTTILATHNSLLARRAERVLALQHGKLVPGADALADEILAVREAAGAGPAASGGLG